MENFQLDRLSFWLGFLAGSIAWVLLFQVRKFWPSIREYVRKQLEISRERRLAGVRRIILEDVYRRAQSNHLLSQLCGLDEIVIRPNVLIPPPEINPENLDLLETQFRDVVGFIPEFPEFAAQIDAEKIALKEAVRTCKRIVLIGKPGSGKTTALAYIASLLSDSGIRNPGRGVFPLYLHFHELNFNPSDDPIKTLITAIAQFVPINSRNRASRYLNGSIQGSNCLLILDGLDELSPTEFSKAEQFLKGICQQRPLLKILTTSSTESIDGLAKLEFEPLPIAGWTRQETTLFLHKFSSFWNKQVAVPVNQQSSLEILDDLLVKNWLGTDPIFKTPLEWVLWVWGAFAGDLLGTSPHQITRSYLLRTTQGKIPDSALVALSKHMLTKKMSAINFLDAEKLLSQIKGLSTESADPSSSDAPRPDLSDLEQPPKETSKNRQLSSGEKIIGLLTEARVLIEVGGDFLAFLTPVFAGYAYHLSNEPLGETFFNQRPVWSIESEVVRQSLIKEQIPIGFKPLLANLKDPLFSDMIAVSTWLRDLPSNHPTRSLIMRSLVTSIQEDGIPIGIRMKLLAAMTTSNDTSVLILLRQWLASKSEILRELAALGCGVLQDQKSIQELIKLLNDEFPAVRFAACQALSVIESSEAQRGVWQALASGDESLRINAAETLASHPDYGHELLKEAISSDDLLMRRSAVFGLSKVNQPWAVESLEKMAVEDGQWVVRNAAAQALESIQHGLYKPVPAQESIQNSQWLIEFASRLGLGVPKVGTPVPLLLQVLKSGSQIEQYAALQYLRNFPEETVQVEVFNFLYGGDPVLQEAAQNCLWFMQISGADLVQPSVFGFA